MCGLVGFAGNNIRSMQKAFTFMLLVDQIRGFHSTGIVTAGNKGAGEVFKRALNSTDFLDMRQPDKIINKFDYSAIIGHNRAATLGLINTANAHPFQIGDITLAHNGTLRQQRLLPDYLDFEVDSENICHSINKIGIDNTVKLLCGAFALTYFDDADKTLNLVRNSERPLYYAITTNKQSIMWASEAWMITVAAHKSDIKIDAPILLPVGSLMTVGLDVNDSKDINKSISFREIELHTLPKPYQARGTGGQYIGNQNIPDIQSRYNYVLNRHELIGESKYYYGKTVDGCFDVVIHSSGLMRLGATYSSKIKSWSTGVGGRRLLDMGDYVLVKDTKVTNIKSH